jgi:hypothetical protein
MTSQPDKLFRDTLENFQQPAPAGAWDKIQSNLARPAYKLVWVRVAAGMALLAAAAIVLWPSEKPETKIAKSTEHTVTKKDTTQQRLEKIEATNEIIVQPKPSVFPQPTNTVTIAKTEKQAPVQQSSIRVKKDSVLSNPLPESNESIAETVQFEEKAASKTIVYTADEVNAKFLKKKLPPEATPGSKEASGIQKLIGLAYDAKNSEAPLRELRQKKDDILALNFGKKKGEN